MPNTPGFKRPLRVEKEVKEVKVHFDSLVLLNSPSREEVRESLKSANIVHFICHRTSKAFNPSNSGLVLTDSRLTVRDLAALSLDQAQIAYLSACSTTDNKTRDLVDESIHISSAFNLAGFPHVVGTFWPASNKITERVAPKFYEILNEGQQKEENNSDVVARALQEAVKSLWCSNNKKMRAFGERNISSDNVIGWAPYIHIGA
jgi:CHAT domain-containing protein